MSYILEALKKSERERAKGKIPTLETVYDTGLSRRGLWLGVLIGAGTLVLVALAAWVVNLQFFQETESQSLGDGADSRAARLASDAGAAAARREKPVSQPPAETPPATATVRATEVPATSEAPATTGPRPSPQRVSGVAALDPDTRALVEGLSVNVVSYSRSPERRFVMLSQRIYRESDVVADGVVVKEILAQGVLLEAGGYEILLGAD